MRSVLNVWYALKSFISPVTATISRGLVSFVIGMSLPLSCFAMLSSPASGVAVLRASPWRRGKRIERRPLYALRRLELSARGLLAPVPAAVIDRDADRRRELLRDARHP